MAKVPAECSGIIVLYMDVVCHIDWAGVRLSHLTRTWVRRKVQRLNMISKLPTLLSTERSVPIQSAHLGSSPLAHTSILAGHHTDTGPISLAGVQERHNGQPPSLFFSLVAVFESELRGEPLLLPIHLNIRLALYCPFKVNCAYTAASLIGS